MMQILMVLATLLIYVLLLFYTAHRSQDKGDNDTFFRGQRQSNWLLVAFGMIGASVSGVSMVSVPGWVRHTGMTYLQMCAGFFAGYLFIAFVLLPLYYRLHLTSIYSYLGQRFGNVSHRTGAAFFCMSKLTGASARLYLACVVLHELTAATLGLHFGVTVAIVLTAIFLYTLRGGIRTLVHTDVLQTACLLLTTVAMIAIVASQMHLDLVGVVATVADSTMGKVFCWDVGSTAYFWRQFVNGMFITIVMTGLDQDMMQKNLTCRTQRDAQKDMCLYGACFLPVNLLFLTLGVLMFTFASQTGITLPDEGDMVLPTLIQSGALGNLIVIPFTLGIASAALSSADSAMTSLTTCVCVDFLDLEQRVPNPNQAIRTRRLVHTAVAMCFAVCIALFYATGGGTIIDTIYRMAGYTYGPLLGLFAFGILTHRSVRDKWVPIACLLSPTLCAALDYFAPIWWGYQFSYELLLLNAAITFSGLWLIGLRKTQSA